MRVLVEQFDRAGRLISEDVFCETHGREMVTRLHGRWPEPHEHAATKGDHSGKTRVRLYRDDETTPCLDCVDEHELTTEQAEQAVTQAFYESLARVGAHRK